MFIGSIGRIGLIGRISMVTVSAPGKLMVMGEHAVVYGHPCIVTAVDRRLTVEAQRTKGKDVVVESPQVNDTRFVRAAIAASSGAFGVRGGMRIRTECPFTNAYGFGSSSAVVVATIRALSDLFEKQIEEFELFRMAYRAVRSVQGVGSGFDVAAAVYGGTIVFRKGGEEIHPLSRAIPLIVGYTGVKADTPTFVRIVADRRRKQPAETDGILEDIGKLVRRARKEITALNWQELGSLMNKNHGLLTKLGVSTPKLDRLVSAARKAGAWGAKLSGAGGGDCMIAVAPKNKQKAVENAIENAGGEIVHVATDAPGVREETTDDQAELFVVVDRNDRVIGYRTRYACHHDRSLIHRSVGAVIFDPSGRILLQKRSRTKDLQPGLWGLSVAGHVTKGETYTAAIRRELSEELGVELPLTVVGKTLFTGSDETEISAIYETRSDGPFHPDPREISALRFFGKGELDKKISSGNVMLTPWTQKVLTMINVLP